MSPLEYDFIIVGGGTSGLVVAVRLTQNPNIRILVLEAAWFEWEKGPPCPGTLLGGSSAVNGQAFVAPSKFSVDAWAKFGNTGWDWEGFAPYFQASCTLTKPSPAACAHLGLDYIDEKSSAKFTGPIHASFAEEVNDPLPKAWVETFKRLGYPVSGDPFTGEAVGGYINSMNIHPVTKQRSYATNAYYDPVRTRNNLQVVTSALVEKILLEGHATEVLAKGVSYVKDGKKQTAIASKEVILAAGVFNTPKLLELSGIGSASLLESLKIPVVIDNGNVGENLQDHPNAGLSFEVADGVETIDGLARQDMAAIGAAMEAYTKTQSGPFASGGNFSGGFLPVLDFISPEGEKELQRLLQFQIHDNKPFSKYHTEFVDSLLHTATEGSGGFFSYPAQGNFIQEVDIQDIIGSSSPGNYLTICCMLLHPLSRGSSHINSSSPGTKMTIDPKYLSNPLDLEILARHVRYIGKIVSSEPLKSFLKPGGRRSHGAPKDLDNLEEVKEYVKKAVLSSWHPTSTCAMLPLEKGGVVNTKLLVYGTKNLRIVDASVIPLSTRGNCQTTVYAVAEKAADLIKYDHGIEV